MMQVCSSRQQFVALLFAVALLLSSRPASAGDPQRVAPIDGPRRVSDGQVANNHRIYNEIIVDNLPPPARQADVDDKGRVQEEPGRGIRQMDATIGIGLELDESPRVCNDFNQPDLWHSSTPTARGIWSESYGGWTPYAFDDGDLYRQEHVTFVRERVVGPGSHYGPDQSSLKIASGQPYAAGISSPPLSVPPNARVQVMVKYLIFDHDVHGQDYDWVSLTIKPNGEHQSIQVSPVNGYSRGRWAELRHSLIVGDSSHFQVFIQAHSPAALNSNIYIDDIEVRINGRYMEDCVFEQ